MASDEVQPVTAQQPIEGELLNVLTTSNEQILNLISPTHLPDEENFDAYSLLYAVERGRAKCIANFLMKDFQGQKNLEEKVSRLGDNFNPQLLCILKQLSSEMACEAPSVEVIMSILNKLSNYSWEAKLLLILAAYSLNYEDFLNIPYDTLKGQKRQKMFRVNSAIDNTLRTMGYFLGLKKVTKDEPELLSDVEGDIAVGVYWIIVTCTTHDMCCLTSDEDKTQDLSPLVDKIRSIFSDLGMRISTIEKMIRTRKLKELFPRDAMQPLIDGSTNEQVSIDVLKEKNILLFISGLNIHKNDMSNLMSIYDGIKEEEDQYKIVWIPIVEQWTIDSRKKFEMLQSKMPWYIVQYFSAVAAIKFIKKQYNNKPIVLLINPQGYVENEDTVRYFIQRYAMGDFPFNWPRIEPCVAYQRPRGPYEIQGYTFLYGGKDKQWIEQFYQKVKAVAEDKLIEEGNIIIEYSSVGEKSKDDKQLDFDEEIKKKLRSFKNERRWAVFMTIDSEVISDDGKKILQILRHFEVWKEKVREKSFQNCFEEASRLLPTGSQPTASRNV